MRGVMRVPPMLWRSWESPPALAGDHELHVARLHSMGCGDGIAKKYPRNDGISNKITNKSKEMHDRTELTPQS